MTAKRIVLIAGVVVIVLALVAAAFVGGIFGFAVYQVGKSEAAAKAKDFLRNNQKLKDDIGEIKDFGSIITSSFDESNGNSEATLKLKVIGNQKTVNATVQLIYTNASAWRVSGASYVSSSGQTINLLDPYDSQVPTPVLIA